MNFLKYNSKRCGTILDIAYALKIKKNYDPQINLDSCIQHVEFSSQKLMQSKNCALLTIHEIHRSSIFVYLLNFNFWNINFLEAHCTYPNPGDERARHRQYLWPRKDPLRRHNTSGSLDVARIHSRGSRILPRKPADTSTSKMKKTRSTLRTNYLAHLSRAIRLIVQKIPKSYRSQDALPNKN